MGASQSEFRGTRKAFNILIPQILASEAHFDVSVEVMGPHTGIWDCPRRFLLHNCYVDP